MKRAGEFESLDFLEGAGFDVVPRSFSRGTFSLRGSIKRVGHPYILKATGAGIPSTLGIKKYADEPGTYTELLQIFKKLRRIKGSNGVLVKKKIGGEEFFVRVRKTPSGKSYLSFKHIDGKNHKLPNSKSFPITNKKLEKLFKDTKVNKILSSKENKTLEGFIMKLCKFLKEHIEVLEVVVGSLFLSKEGALIANARITFV